MTRVGIPAEDQEAIMRTVAAILHLGNIAFKPGPNESSLPATAAAEHHLGAAGAVLLSARRQERML